MRDKAGFKHGVKRLESQGHQVEIDKDALTSYERFAGDDQTRLQAISRAACRGTTSASSQRCDSQRDAVPVLGTRRIVTAT